ncbi:MAG TPA: aldose epimerase family protein [Vicinamibacterales bacterium]|nr:aldose epimerase family protein [Vicinamibacterales bacterium]
MVNRRTLGILPDGAPVDVITFGDQGAFEVQALTYGCIIASLAVPDASGRLATVVLGFERLQSYLNDSPYFGAAIGRYANRIANATFAIDGRHYPVSRNEPPNHLHGGFKGFDKRLWEAEVSGNGRAVVFRRTSPDGEEGYPGALDAQVIYTIADSELRVHYDAVTDAPTHVNLTQHSYFNLRGDGDVLEHRLAVNAGTYLPVDERLIPTGEIAPVANTPFDFQDAMPIGSRLHTAHEQLKRGGGYDHNFNLNRTDATLSLAARVMDPSSGRTLEVHTTEPGLQFYSGQVVGYRGFCLEPQHYPDSPNRPEFPSTLLRPGERYHSTTVYKFSTETM